MPVTHIPTNSTVPKDCKTISRAKKRELIFQRAAAIAILPKELLTFSEDTRA